MAASKSASAKNMLGDFPPSSSVTRFTVSAACLTMILPTAALPVNAILFTSGCLHQRCAASFAESGNDVHHSRRKPDIRKPVRHFQRGERSLLGRLQNASTTRSQRRRQFPCRHQQRIVPGNNLSGNTDRLFQRKTDRIIGNRIYVAENFCRQAAVVFEAGCDVSDVIFGFDDRLAGSCGIPVPRASPVFCRIFSARRNSTRPRSCAVVVAQGHLSNAALAPRYRAIHVFRVRVRNLRDYFFG